MLHKFMAVALLLPSISHAYFSDAETINKKSFRLIDEFTYRSLDGTFDNSGEKVDFLDGYESSDYYNDLKISYGISGQLELTLGGTYYGYKLDENAMTTDDARFINYFIGAKYRFKPVDKLTYTLELGYVSSTLDYDKNFPDENEALGPIGGAFFGGLHIMYTASENFKVTLSGIYEGGYDNGVDKVKGKLEAALFNETLYGRGGVIVDYGVADNRYEEPPMGPVLEEPKDPYFVMPYGGVGATIGNFTIGVDGGIIAKGTNTDSAKVAMVNVRYQTVGRSPAKIKESRFKQYDVEGSVIKISPRGAFVKIDQGIDHNVMEKMRFDIFKTDYFGENIMVASGIVHQVGTDWAIIKLTKKYRNIPIDTGFTARGY